MGPPTFRETVSRLWPYLVKRKVAALGMLGLGVVAALGAKATLVFIHPFVDLLFREKGDSLEGEGGDSFLDKLSSEQIEPWLDSLQYGDLAPPLSGVLALVGLMAGLALVFSIAQYFFLRLSRMIGVWMVADLRQDLTSHVLKLDVTFHSKRRLGDLVSRVTADVGATLRTLQLLLGEIVQEPLHLFATFLVAWAAEPTATLGMVIFIPVVAFPVAKLGPRIKRRSARSQEKLGATNHSLLQMLSGIRVVKAFRAEEREAANYRRYNQEFVGQTDRMVRAQAASQAVTLFASQGGAGLALGALVFVDLAVTPIFSGPGTMTVFFVAVASMFAHAKRITKSMNEVFASLGAAQRVFEVLDIEPETPDSAEAAPFNGVKSSIQFENVTFDYGAGEGPALDDVSLTIKRGERIALVGPSGAGKSTLLDLLGRFHSPTSGRIFVDGHPLDDIRRSDWLTNVSLVPQDPFLFQDSIRENVRYGKPDAGDEEVLEACQAAQLGSFLQSLPDGLDTQVGEAGARLSGGQAQRVTIARAFLQGADLLLLDEATSALDSEAEQKVQAALANLMKGRTVVAIAHRLGTVKGSDRIVVLNSGKIAEIGSHETLLKDSGNYSRMWALQSGQ
ncbi:MAG TPA: hypothetical protein DDW23_03545 [Planctomycetes bacterium]|nr:hypothetical protein [Planctomycetota bacterium]